MTYSASAEPWFCAGDRVAQTTYAKLARAAMYRNGNGFVWSWHDDWTTPMPQWPRFAEDRR